MKKIVPFILIVLSLLTLPLFGACGKEEKAPVLSDKTTVNPLEAVSDFDSLHIGNYLGKVTVNADKGFVKEGERSAKITVIGNRLFESGEPYLYQSFMANGQADYSDFSKVHKVSLWLFNAQDEKREVCLQPEFEGAGILTARKYALAAKGWTLVEYSLNPDVIQELSKEMVCIGAYILFPNPADAAVPDTYYLDEITISKKTPEGKKPVITLNKGEVCSFDNPYQVELARPGYGNNPFLAPRLSLDGFTQHNKGYSMKIEAPHGYHVYPYSQNYPGVTLYEPMLKQIDWASYDYNDTLCFDAYTELEGGGEWWDIVIELYNSSGERFYFSEASRWNLRSGKWTTVRLTVNEITQRAYELKWDADPDYMFGDISRIAICWGEFVGENRILYVDNMRLERGE